MPQPAGCHHGRYSSRIPQRSAVLNSKCHEYSSEAAHRENVLTAGFAAGVPMTFAREEIPTAEAEQYGTPDAEAPTHEHDHSAHDFAELRRQGLAGIDPAAHSRHAVFRKPVRAAR